MQGKEIYGKSVLSTQFCCEPKTPLLKKKSLFKKAMVTGAILAQQTQTYSRHSEHKGQKQQEQSEKGKNSSQLLSGSSCSPHTLYNKSNQFPELQFHKFRQADACFLQTQRIIPVGYTMRYYLLKSLLCELLNHQEIKIQKFFIGSPPNSTLKILCISNVN